MKKLTLILACLVVLTAMFFAACGNGDDTPAATTYTLTLTEGDITVYPTSAETKRNVRYTLTASDGNTSGITVSVISNDDACLLTASGAELTIPANATPGGPYNFSAEAVKDGKKVASKGFTVTIGDAGAIPQYSVTVTVTLGADKKAQLEEGELLCIAGGWVDGWDQVNLTKQANGTWTGTIEDVEAGTISFEYRIHAMTDAENDYWDDNISAGSSQVFYYPGGGATVPLNFTVTEWIGRPIVYNGNMFADSDFAQATSQNWRMEESGWDYTGLDEGVRDDDTWGYFYTIQGTPDGIGPAPNTGAAGFFDWHKQSESNYVLNGTTLTLTQDIDATENGLSAGVQVTMYAWIYRNTTEQKDFAFICGAQTGAVTPTMAEEWQELEYTFTLAAADITDGAVTAGFKYTADGDNCRTGIDLLAFVKK